jgi:hypothetical protein
MDIISWFSGIRYDLLLDRGSKFRCTEVASSKDLWLFMACRRWYESTGNTILSCLVHYLYSTSLYFQSCWGPLSVKSDSRSHHFILPLLLADFLFVHFPCPGYSFTIETNWKSVSGAWSMVYLPNNSRALSCYTLMGLFSLGLLLWPSLLFL